MKTKHENMMGQRKCLSHGISLKGYATGGYVEPIGVEKTTTRIITKPMKKGGKATKGK